MPAGEIFLSGMPAGEIFLSGMPAGEIFLSACQREKSFCHGFPETLEKG
jgi:hypothetical protein